LAGNQEQADTHGHNQRLDRRAALRRSTGCCGGAVAIVAAGILALLFLMQSLFGGMCETTIYGRKVSPDGASTAALFMIDCGATTSFNRRVALRPRNMPLWSGHWRDNKWLGDGVFAIHGQRDVRLSWSSPRQLVISVPDDPRFAGEVPFVAEQEWRDVRVRWVRLSPSRHSTRP
jgi:hypothetical protein